MNRRYGRLAPLTSLEGFEAAARLGSFSKAAEELNITQSAVSHQIRLLEDFFGQPLFQRVRRSVELTDAGADFLETVTRTLETLSQGQQRLEHYLKPGSVVVATSPLFARRWLLPRLPLLRDQHPDIQPWLYTTDEELEIAATEIDIAILFGDGNWPDMDSVKLFHDRLTPLCAPSLLEASPTLPGPEALAKFPLLHDERHDDWLAWFHAAGYSDAKPVTGYNFSDPSLALDMALEGMGIALCSLPLTAGLIESGLLVQPFETVLETQDAYYLAVHRKYADREEVKVFQNWLRSALKEDLSGRP